MAFTINPFNREPRCTAPNCDLPAGHTGLHYALVIDGLTREHVRRITASHPNHLHQAI